MADSRAVARLEFRGAAAAERGLLAHDAVAPLNVQQKIESAKNGAQLGAGSCCSPDVWIPARAKFTRLVRGV